MSIIFTKMHALGNDFMVIDTGEQKISLTREIIKQWADRRTGVGFDQLLLIEPSINNEHDYLYRIFNASGQEVEQCGNGARCVAHYIFTRKQPQSESITLATLSGKIELKKAGHHQITVNMGVPIFDPKKIPFISAQQAVDYELMLDGNPVRIGAVSFGNPHAVITVKDVLHAPVQQIGRLLQHHSAFPNQVNVGFMQIVSPTNIHLRVYERGVGETRSCGSGACAAVAIGRACHQLADKVTVELPGGSLVVSWRSMDEPVFLTGPAEEVYRGELLI